MENIAAEHGGKITGVRVRLGALAHISADHFREHFVQGTRGTCAESATLEIEVGEDINEPHAQEILLESVEVDS